MPNSISGAPNGTGSGSITTMISADAPGTYANGIGTNLDIIDRVGDAPLSTSNSQSYNMIPYDKTPYVPEYVGAQTTNAFEMSFDIIKTFSKDTFKETVKKHVKTAALKGLQEIQESHSKSKKLNYNELKMQEYLTANSGMTKKEK